MFQRYFVQVITIGSFLFFACTTDKIDDSLAKQKAETFLKAIIDSNYQVAEKSYTVNFQKSEPFQNRVLKFNQLRKLTGPIYSIQLVQIINEQKVGEESSVTLVYRLVGNTMSLKHTLVLVRDEGDIRVAVHYVQNDN
jgi:hypothetical protein